MIREMSLRNALLQRSDNDWLDGLLAEKPEYEGSLRMVVGMSAWMYDIANSPFAMRTLAASEAGSREVSASATAMREVSASEVAVAAIIGTDQALATVVASAVAMSAISASAVAMSAISASAVAMDAIKNNPTAYASVLGNHMAVGKFAVGAAGLDPAPYADIEAVAASSTAMQAVAASSTAIWCAASAHTPGPSFYLWIQNITQYFSALQVAGKKCATSSSQPAAALFAAAPLKTCATSPRPRPSSIPTGAWAQK